MFASGALHLRVHHESCLDVILSQDQALQVNMHLYLYLSLSQSRRRV